MKRKVSKFFAAAAALVAAMAVIALASCAQLGDEDSQSETLTVSLPPLSRAMTGDELAEVRERTSIYRVTMNNHVFTGRGDSPFSARFEIGTRVKITIECLNGYGDVIARTVRTHQVVYGRGRNDLTLAVKDGEYIEIELTAKWNEMTTLYVNSTGNDTTGDGSQAKPLATLNKAFTLINAMTGTTKEIKLASNISVNDTVTLDSVGKDVTLTSDNGTVRIVSLGLSLDRKNMISILNGNLTMTNITLDGQKDNGILITNNSSVIDVRGKSKLTLDNTTLQNFKVEYSSLRGFIEVTGAESSLMMQNKSKIQNNHFDMNGNGAATGSVNMSEGASFTMKSGTFIRDNSCTRTGQSGSFYGLGVYLLKGSSATVEDENGITNNTFTTDSSKDNKVYIVGNADTPITYNGVDKTQEEQIK